MATEPTKADTNLPKEQLYYDGTYLASKGDDPRCTLLTRHYRKYATPSKNTVTLITPDAKEYPDEATMVADIKAKSMLELPEEADGKPLYIPAGFEAKTVRRK